MPVCKKFDELSIVQKITKVGQLVHIYQSDDTLHEHLNQLIELATLKGLFDGVVINPTSEETKTDNN